jgi:HTH-type transcriptional regulator / antitoxin HigA
VIGNDREFDHLVELMEEEALAATLAVLIQDYDDKHHQLPKTSPDRRIRLLMEQRGLRQADLLPIFGTRSVASDVITGKREASKAHVRKLAEFFRVPAELFL